MAQTITRTYPDEWVQRLLPAINERATAIEGHRLIQKLLQDRGVTPDEKGRYHVDGLNVREKAELIIDLTLWKLVQSYEIRAAEELARQQAAQALQDSLQGGDA